MPQPQSHQRYLAQDDGVRFPHASSSTAIQPPPYPSQFPARERTQRKVAQHNKLHPEAASWVVPIKAYDPPQPTSRDVHGADRGEDELDDGTSLAIILHHTILDIEFDHSCFEGLDDELLCHPFDAFANMCWEDAVEPVSARRSTTPTPWRDSDHDRPSSFLGYSSDESDSDSDECRTYTEDDAPMPPVHEGDGSLSAVHPVGEISAIQVQRIFYDPPIDDGASFIFVAPHFRIFDPKESISFFPVPAVRPNTNRPNRIAAFFSGRLARSPASPPL